MKTLLKDFILALSLANLCLTMEWIPLLRPHVRAEAEGLFHTPAPYFASYVGIVLTVVVLAVIFWLPIGLARLTRNQNTYLYSHYLWFLPILLVLFYLRTTIRSELGWTWLSYGTLVGLAGSVGARLFVVAALLTLTVLIALYHRKVVPCLRALLWICVPFLISNLFQAGYWIGSGKYYSIASPSSIRANDERRYVYWIVFDALDQGHLFDQRPSDVKLPEFDRFRTQALYSENAYPPGRRTLQSMASITTGKLIEHVEPISRDEAELYEVGSDIVHRWEDSEDIFKQVRKLGFRTRILGWAKPYCRLFAGDLDYCFTQPCSYQAQFSYHASVQQSVKDYLMRLVSFNTFRFWAGWHHAHYKLLQQNTRHVLADQRPGLTLLHYNIPHSPWIYNRFNGSYLSEKGAYDWDGYFDNLALADRTLLEIRKQLEAQGIWEKSTVVVFGDHWLSLTPGLDESKYYRIPFMVKLPNQKHSVVYERPFNVTSLYDLTLKIFTEGEWEPSQLVQWLDINANHPIGPYGVSSSFL